MKITSTILTKMAEAESDNASYFLEYNIKDGILERVQATVYRKSTSEQRVAIGSIYYDRGSVTVNMPFSAEMALYVADFHTYVEDIIGEVATELQTIETTENK